MLNVRKFDRVIGYNYLDNFVGEVLQSEYDRIDSEKKSEELWKKIQTLIFW